MTADGDDPETVTTLQRRRVVQAGGALGFLPLAMGSGNAAEDNATDREGTKRKGTITSQASSEGIIDAVATDTMASAIVETEYLGVTEQSSVFTQSAQGFPVAGDAFAVLSSGNAAEALGSPEFFASTGFSGGRTFNDYSPDGYDAYDVLDIVFEIAVPQEAQGIAFDYKFASDESPGYLGSKFQDFFEAILSTRDGFSNIAQINGQAVTVDTADAVANTPTGGSQNPNPPLPEPPDVVYNAVTDQLTASADISAYQGDTVTLTLRIADASDAIYDSAVFIDNLRFVGDIEKDVSAVQTAFTSYREAITSLIESEVQTWAEYEAKAIETHGEEYLAGIEAYWGYKAGAVSEGAVPEDLLVLSENVWQELETAGQIDSADAEMYAFMQELHAAVDVDAPSAETIAAYYLGTAPGQSNYLTVGGQSIDDRIKTIGAAIDDQREAVVTALQSEEFSQAEVQAVASRVAERAASLKRQQEDARESVEQLGELLTADTDITGQLAVQQLSSITEQGDTSTQGLGVLGVGVYSILKGVGVVAGKTTVGIGAKIGLGKVSLGAAGGAAAAGYGITGGQVSSGASLGSISQTQVAQHNTMIQQLQYKAAEEAVDTTAEELLNRVDAILEKATITDLEAPDITAAETKNINILDQILNILPIVGSEATTVGKQTGSVTVENTGVSPIEALGVDGTVRIYSQADNAFVEYEVLPEVSEVPGSIEPGEQETVEFEYTVPYEDFGSKFQLEVSARDVVEYTADAPWVGPNPTAEPLATERTTFTAGASGESISAETLQASELADGESSTMAYTPAGDITQFVVDISWGSHYLDLHLYDADGNHTGYNYETNSIDTEIPNSSYSGRVTHQNGFEWIAVDDRQSESYEVEVIAPEVGTVTGNSVAPAATGSTEGTVEPSAIVSSSYEVTTIETPELDATFGSVPTQLTVESEPADTTLTSTLQLSELNGDNPLTGVTVDVGTLTAETSDSTIAAEQVAVSDTGFDIPAGGTASTTLTVDLTADQPPGVYTGTVAVESNEDATSTTMAIRVQSDGRTVAYYADDQTGMIENDGLFQASEDWRNDEIETDLLFAVAQAWRTDEVVAP